MKHDDESAAGGSSGGIEAVLAASSMGGRLQIPFDALRRTSQAIATNPGGTVKHLTDLWADQWAILRGDDMPNLSLDRRFADAAWTENPWLRRWALGYLATCEAAMQILDDADIDWRTREQVRLLLDNVLAASAPTNTFAGNPAAWKRFIDTGGLSAYRGTLALLEDLAQGRKLPRQVDESAFEVGTDIATTPGQVIRRERGYELLQFNPTTPEVDATPVLFVASPVNKYYLMDLSEQGSVLRSELGMGRQVFVASWVNPNEDHADLGFDAYVESIVQMLETAADVTGSSHVHLLGLCGGGQLSLLAAAYLAAVGREELLASLTLGIAVTEFSHGNSSMAYLDQETVDKAIESASDRGYFDAESTAMSFALIRPVDGIWSNVVNNYLLGAAPPAFNLLYWAADQTNMSLQFGRDTMSMTVNNGLARPGGVSVLGAPLDVSAITVPTYVLGASTDHICPWQDCYRSLQLIGDNAFFVLGYGGHAAMISRPAGSKKAKYWLNPATPADPQEWLHGATEHHGSWWEHWNQWIAEQTPDRVPAPSDVGNSNFPPLEPAPGSYVRVRVVD